MGAHPSYLLFFFLWGYMRITTLSSRIQWGTEMCKRIKVPPEGFGQFAEALPPGYWDHTTRDLRERCGNEFVDKHENALRCEFFQNAHLWARWAYYGLNVFELTESLVTGLSLTKRAEFNPEDLAMPFPAFCISVPPGHLPLWENGKRVGWGARVWFHVLKSRMSAEDEDALWSHIVIEPSAQDRELKKLPDLWRVRPLSDMVGPNPEDKNLTEQAGADGRRWFETMEDSDTQTIELALDLVLNFLSWLNHTGGLATRSPERGQRPVKNTKVRQEPSIVQWVLGREVKLSRELREAAQGLSLGRHNPREDWQVQARFIVRGHWRNQACGVKLAERRQTWIEPYWKGPEGAQVWSHIYTTGEQT